MSMPSGKQPAPGPLARSFSAHVKGVMDRERITISAMAEATGLSRNYLGKRLRDEVPFTLNDVEVICEVLGLTPPKLD
ncbi:helix-turn-helix domain-containing protein [Arthrobacter sp. MA-N2]|uniref:helix-turn-helix domain-containing protein n=1 Tax=Arthrobacter sp. MA-N2 TaxID=1101188 RepID=UPI0004832021|nr:helix-turn-helix transcriptional regulator [Arthrobacter sp. MA-N2]